MCANVCVLGGIILFPSGYPQCTCAFAGRSTCRALEGQLVPEFPNRFVGWLPFWPRCRVMEPCCKAVGSPAASLVVKAVSESLRTLQGRPPMACLINFSDFPSKCPWRTEIAHRHPAPPPGMRVLCGGNHIEEAQQHGPG